MSRDVETFIFSAVAGFLGAITYLLTQEINYAQAQQRRAAEDARARYSDSAPEYHHGR